MPILPEVLWLLDHWDDDVCPKCGNALSETMLHCGGRGYKPYLMCGSGECEYMRKLNS